jgi:hypothetical protein
VVRLGDRRKSSIENVEGSDFINQNLLGTIRVSPLCPGSEKRL